MLDIKKWIAKTTQWISAHNYTGYGTWVDISDRDSSNPYT